jgi:hypothetical protein
MTMTADELAERTGLPKRKISATLRGNGIQPIHYVKDAGRLVAVYDDDVLERLEDSSGFGMLAHALGTDTTALAELVMKYYPGGGVSVPTHLRRR